MKLTKHGLYRVVYRVDEGDCKVGRRLTVVADSLEEATELVSGHEKGTVTFTEVVLEAIEVWS